MPQKVIAAVPAFGAGVVLLPAVSFELVGEAYGLAGRGARHRKRSGHGQVQPSEEQRTGPGAGLALGAPLDGVPESAVTGVSLLDGGVAVSLVTVAAVFLSTKPDGSRPDGSRPDERQRALGTKDGGRAAAGPRRITACEP